MEKKKTCTVRQATDNSMEHAHRMQHNYGYEHTLGTCNPYSFFHHNHGYANAPHCYVTRTLPIMLKLGQDTCCGGKYKV